MLRLPWWRSIQRCIASGSLNSRVSILGLSGSIAVSNHGPSGSQASRNFTAVSVSPASAVIARPPLVLAEKLLDERRQIARPHGLRRPVSGGDRATAP